VFEESTMGKTRRAYPPEFRRQMIELVHAGRSPEELAHGDGGLTTAEREELNRLRRENRQLRLERKIYPDSAEIRRKCLPSAAEAILLDR
jgi:transposase